MKLHLIGPRKPMENACAESPIGRLRDDCLSGNRFLSFMDARKIIEAWRKDYNGARPPGSLGGLPPREYAEKTAGLQLALASTTGQGHVVNGIMGGTTSGDGSVVLKVGTKEHRDV